MTALSATQLNALSSTQINALTAAQVAAIDTGDIAALTTREREVMQLMVAGKPSKVIARELAISARTVENHRAAIMKKMGAKSLPALARVAMAAGEE